MDSSDQPGSRTARTARNDTAILEAAREVFVRDPEAPVAAVAKVAGVGISALYRRYPSKEALIARLCLDGLHELVRILQAAHAVPDPWASFSLLVRAVVDTDVHLLTVGLAGRFRPGPEHDRLADQADDLARRVLTRAQGAGVVRPDLVTEDLPMIYEQLVAVRMATPQRTLVLRRRYVELTLDGMRAGAREPVAEVGTLPGEPPTPTELEARWLVR